MHSPPRRLQSCAELRNEVDPADTTDFGAKPPLALTIAVLSAVHFLCCGVPLLVLSGVSLATLIPSWPVFLGTAAVGVLLLCVRRYRKLRHLSSRDVNCAGQSLIGSSHLRA